MKRKTLRINGLLAAAVAFGMFAPVQAIADDNINICHATGSVTNPYRPASPSESSILNLDPNGHGTHKGKVFDPTINTKSASGPDGTADWGDIIPAFTGFPGQNVADGQVWLDGSCAAPAHLTLVKVVTNSHDGTAVAADWTLAADGPYKIAGPSGSSSVTMVAVPAGDFTLSEANGPADYTASPWVCGPEAALRGSILTLAAGKSATCTVTNSDQATIVLPDPVRPDPVRPDPVRPDPGGTTSTPGGTTTKTGATASAGPARTNPIVAPVIQVDPASLAVAPVVGHAPGSPTLAYTGVNGVVPLGIFGVIALVLGAVLTVAAHRPGTSSQAPTPGSTELPPAGRGSAVTRRLPAKRAPACRAAATRRRDRRIQAQFSAHRRMPPLVRRRSTCWIGTSRERR